MSKPKEPITLFGEIVRELRARAGVTQEQLAGISDEIAPYVAEHYSMFENVAGLSRELINQLEAPALKSRPRDRTITVLAYALAEALNRTGSPTDAALLSDKLSAATLPQIHVSNETISREAIILDALLMTFPEDERKAKWAGILAMVRKEREERLNLQKVRKSPHNPY